MGKKRCGRKRDDVVNVDLGKLAAKPANVAIVN